MTASLALVTLVWASVGCGGSENAGGGPAAKPDEPGFYTGGVPGDSPERGGVLRFVVSSLPNGLEPALINLWPQSELYDQLVEWVPGKEKPQPDLATSWRVSPDRLTYDFTLREGVRFSNGEPMTAEDVVYSVRRMATAANATGQFVYPDTFKSVSVVSPTQVRLVLNKPVAALLEHLAWVSIVPQSAFRRIDEQFTTTAIGTGPFKVKSFNVGKSLELERNPHYWRRGQPYLDGVSFTVAPDANARILKVRSGGADATNSLPFSQIAALQREQGVVTSIQRLYGVDNVYWNTSRKPFDDVKVRQALAYATPVDDIIKAVYHGYAEPANSIIPKNVYSDPDAKAYTLDLAKARSLMQESSAPNGFSATILALGGDPNSTLLASILQDAWAKLGVKLTIRQVDSNAQVTSMFGGNYQVAAVSSPFFVNDSASPDNSGGLVYDPDTGTHGLASFYENPTMTRLYREAAASSDESLRARSFRRLQQISQENVQLLPLTYIPQTFLLSPHVRNLTAMGNSFVKFEDVYLAR